MSNKRFDALELVKEILGFLGVTAGIFLWMMVMQLIVSFVALSYLHMDIEIMFLVAAGVTVCFDIYYVIHRVRKKRKG